MIFSGLWILQNGRIGEQDREGRDKSQVAKPQKKIMVQCAKSWTEDVREEQQQDRFFLFLQISE